MKATTSVIRKTLKVQMLCIPLSLQILFVDKINNNYNYA